MEGGIMLLIASDSLFLKQLNTFSKVHGNSFRKVIPQFFAALRSKKTQNLTCPITLPQQRYYFRKSLLSIPSYHIGQRYMAYMYLMHFHLIRRLLTVSPITSSQAYWCSPSYKSGQWGRLKSGTATRLTQLWSAVQSPPGGQSLRISPRTWHSNTVWHLH